MTTVVTDRAATTRVTDVETVDRLLALGAIAILMATLTALVRGADEWHRLSPSIWGHLFTICAALAITPVMLLRRRGDRLHHNLGYVWVVALFVTALLSFDIRLINLGQFSPIHILSLWTMTQAPFIVWRARQHDHVRHRRSVRLMVAGALLIAGFFTFPFGRLLGTWLFG